MDLVLFDIDGTILRTRGAGREALEEAFEQVHGWPGATSGISFAGSTDGAIVRDVSARFGARTDTPAVQAAYYRGLARRLEAPGRVEICPGIREILPDIARRAHLGLLTGNWRRSAGIKLGAAGLEEWFGVGAYGDDADDRDDLVPVARARAAAAGLAVDRVFVVGDTPADVSCARAGGACSIVVETGFSTPDELARAGPDLQVPDLARGRGWLLALLAISATG